MTNLIWKGFCHKPGMPKGGMYYVFQCLFCQKPFIAPGYEVNAGRMIKYCSNECQMVAPERIKNLRISQSKINQNDISNPNFKDGRWLYTHFLKESCEMCGSKIGSNGKKKRLLVHHLNKDRTDSSEDNLKTVCFSCHMKIHNPSNYGKYPDYQKW